MSTLIIIGLVKTKTRTWRHIYHDAGIPRPKSHDIEIPRLKNHDIEIPRPKSHDISFCGILTLMPPDIKNTSQHQTLAGRADDSPWLRYQEKGGLGGNEKPTLS